MAEGGLELTEIPAGFVSQVLGLKVCDTTAWSLWLTCGLALYSDLQASFICYSTNKISPQGQNADNY